MHVDVDDGDCRGDDMNKSTVIATCLVNSRMISGLDDAENAVRQVFLTEFPEADFLEWNRDMNDRDAKHIISAVGRASTINVRKFIEDLW